MSACDVLDEEERRAERTGDEASLVDVGSPCGDVPGDVATP